jgi:hypothetical protein
MDEQLDECMKSEPGPSRTGNWLGEAQSLGQGRRSSLGTRPTAFPFLFVTASLLPRLHSVRLAPAALRPVCALLLSPAQLRSPAPGSPPNLSIASLLFTLLGSPLSSRLNSFLAILPSLPDLLPLQLSATNPSPFTCIRFARLTLSL